MAITFDATQLREVGLTHALEVRLALERHLAGKADGEIYPTRFDAVPRVVLSRTTTDDVLLKIAKGESYYGWRENGALWVAYPLSEEGFEEQTLVLLGNDLDGNTWYAFPETYEQHGVMTCIALVKVF